MRLTLKVLQQLLDQNDGFRASTHYKARNFREDRQYRVADGRLLVRSQGKTSWADSRFDNEFVADPEQTRRFVRRNLHRMNTEGLE